MWKQFLVWPLIALLCLQPAWAQAVSPVTQSPQAQQLPQSPSQAALDTLRPNYVLGAGDVIQVKVPEVEEMGAQPYRIDPSGEITLPLIGPVKALGVTVLQLQEEINKKLAQYVVNPQAVVVVVQFRSDPVFLIGAFRTPGIFPLQGQRTLIELLSSLGGLAPNASRRIKISRRKEMGPIPLPSAIEDPDGKGSSVTINITTLTQEINPPEDIALMPYDVISAERMEMVYTSGEILKPGAYELVDRESISVTQLLGISGGPTREANLKKALILRQLSNSPRRAPLEIDVQRISAGLDPDVKLMQNDVLYLPQDRKRGNLRTLTFILVPLIPTLILIGTQNR